MEPTSSSPPSQPLQTSRFHPHCPSKYTSHNFNLNHDEEEEAEEEAELDDHTSAGSTLNPHEREPMFEKPLTPSDVGKLNRLVIPKQHAEKYFPLGGDSADSKGLLLSFEDESGKFWRFRYSYWNSSQSYVLTKGWSRYVKEKQLDAGDVILFQRHRTDGDRLFIGWKRRGAVAAATNTRNAVVGDNSGGNEGWSGRVLYQGHPFLGHIQIQGLGANVPNQPDCSHAGRLVENQKQARTGGKPKRLVRLFGVNLECHQVEESPPSTPASSMVWSQGRTTHQFY